MKSSSYEKKRMRELDITNNKNSKSQFSAVRSSDTNTQALRMRNNNRRHANELVIYSTEVRFVSHTVRHALI